MEGDEINFADAQERREAAKEALNAPADEPEVETNDEPVVEEVTDEPEVETAEKVEGEQTEEEETEEIDEEETGDTNEEAEGNKEETDEGEQEEIEETELEKLRTHDKMVNDLIEALDSTPYPIDFNDPESGMAELGLRLADAHQLYSILDGTGTVKQLFDTIKGHQGQSAHDAVLGKVLEYAAEVGLLEKIGGDVDLNDPVAVENQRLKQEAAARQSTEAENARRQRETQLFNATVSKLREFAADKGVENLVDEFFIPAMAKRVGGNRAIINRIARGNFVDVQKIFDEIHNEIVGVRTKKNNAKVVGRKVRDQRVPKTPAGGEKPTGAVVARQTHDVSTREGRIAASKASLRG